ncbi:hypothetical protein MtrunA17_Chr5g0421691 [Medicago truncatula]|uniref:Uncharacterized protein n=1 Tax=Medicago truncatula TaxID=3880 RepID=A0A396HUW3_MEDTR|nr:hypothetical protein MtrunA17_Chr5g0421691 [Medicago truncatula]
MYEVSTYALPPDDPNHFMQHFCCIIWLQFRSLLRKSNTMVIHIAEIYLSETKPRKNQKLNQHEHDQTMEKQMKSQQDHFECRMN